MVGIVNYEVGSAGRNNILQQRIVLSRAIRVFRSFTFHTVKRTVIKKVKCHLIENKESLMSFKLKEGKVSSNIMYLKLSFW